MACVEIQKSFTVQSTLNNITLWTKPIWWTRIFPKDRPAPSQGLNYSKVVKSIRHGWPNETESDKCIFKIIQSALNEECQIPQTCAEALLRNDDVSGYPLTHRLLMIQIAKRVSKISDIRVIYRYNKDFYY